MCQNCAFDGSVSEASTKTHARETSYCIPAHVSDSLHTSPQYVTSSAESLDFFAMWSYLVCIQYGLHDIVFLAVSKITKK
jgi:hypothetical protein